MHYILITYNRFSLRYKDLPFTIDDTTLKLLQSIAFIVAILTPLGIGIAFFVNLRNRVKTLEKFIETHPLLSHYEAFVKNESVLLYYDSVLRNSSIERMKND